jgi:hypothetical protein
MLLMLGDSGIRDGETRKHVMVGPFFKWFMNLVASPHLTCMPTLDGCVNADLFYEVLQYSGGSEVQLSMVIS